MRKLAPLVLPLVLLSACDIASTRSPSETPAGDQAPATATNSSVGATASATPDVPAPGPTLPPISTPGVGAAGVQPKAPTSLGVSPPPAEAAAAVIMDEASGALLYEVNPHLRLPPASLTKIATAVVTLETLDTSRIVDSAADPVQEWLEDASAMGLQPGDQFSVMELLYGLMLKSGNDAAKELARTAAGSESAFVARMNALATRLGLRDTRFTDVHGLGGPDHYSSAYDLALLARYAMTLPEFREVVGTESRTAQGSRPIDLYNHNPLLNYTPGVTGVKVGYTEEAGNTFVVSVEREGRRIIIVLLNAPNLAFDAIDLIEWTYANHAWP